MLIMALKLFLATATALSLVAPITADANDAGAALMGGILGAIIGNMATQPPPQQPAPPVYIPVPQSQPAYMVRPDPQVQLQINEERQRAASEAADKARQRQQAEAAAKAQQQQAALKTQAAARAKADADARAAMARADADARSRQAMVAKLATDPALVALLGADPRDVTVLIVGKDTPNVIRNIQGNPSFQSAPTACLPFGALAPQPESPKAKFLQTVTHAIEQKGGIVSSEPSLMVTVCEPADFNRYDLVILSAAQVSNGTMEVLTPLVEAIRQREFVSFGKYASTDFVAAEEVKVAAIRAEEARQVALRQEARASFQSRDPVVISAITLLGSSTIVACLMADDLDGVRYLIKRDGSVFADLANAMRPVQSADAIFIALKKRDCTAAIAPAGVLRDVMIALERDGIKADVHAGTIGRDQLADWKVLAEKDLLAKQDQQAKDLEKRRLTDQTQQNDRDTRRRLDAEHQKNDDAARRIVLEQMRKQVVSKATAVVDGVVAQLHTHMTIVRDEVVARKALSRQPLSTFQPWSGWLETKIKEGWEFGDINSTIEDYGRAQWKARTIEAISMRTEFPMLNRVIGEKVTACVDFIWINDEEFGFRRNPITIECDKYDPAFSAWSEQNGFVSQWKLLPNSE
jgi:multidrug efflux pump subunit AcrA (membrane-fusion protein)